jgi:hypothetical protein
VSGLDDPIVPSAMALDLDHVSLGDSLSWLDAIVRWLWA